MSWGQPFTPEMDAKLIEVIEAGAKSWTEVGAAVGKTGPLARQRIERGLCRKDLIEVMRLRRPLPPEDQTRQRSGPEALPVGHPLTWGTLIAGTVLDGAPATASAAGGGGA